MHQPLVGPLDETVELVFRGKERLQNCYGLEDTEGTLSKQDPGAEKWS